MRISDWSSDVCSSDLAPLLEDSTRRFDLGTFDNLRPLDLGQSYTNNQTFLLNPASAGMYVHVVSQLSGDPNNLHNTGLTATEVTNAPANPHVPSLVQAAPATPAPERTGIVGGEGVTG